MVVKPHLRWRRNWGTYDGVLGGQAVGLGRQVKWRGTYGLARVGEDVPWWRRYLRRSEAVLSVKAIPTNG